MVSDAIVSASDIAFRSDGWQNVDNSREPSAFVEYLDMVDDAVGAMRRRNLVFLGVVPGHRVLDVGCGTGEVVIDLAAAVVPGVRAVGVDCSETMLSTARVRAARAGVSAEFVLGDANALEFADSSFDAVHCERVLQHLEEPHVVIAEMARILVPGGRLMLSEPDWDGFLLDAEDVETTRAVREILVGHVRSPRIGRALRRHVASAGLDVVDFNGGLGFYAISRAAADRMWNLRALLECTVEAGTVQRDTADTWWAELGALEDSGRFFAGGVGFRVLAIKPA